MSSKSRRVSDGPVFSTNVVIQKNIERSRKPLFRSPKTEQEKFLCGVACFVFVIMMVFLAALCILLDRYNATLSKLPFFISDDEVCDTDVCKETATKMLSNSDPSTDPCIDFYQYACGGWMKNNPLTDKKIYISQFTVRRKVVSHAVTELIENLGNTSQEVEEPRAITAFKSLYKGCKNKGTRDTLGGAPLAKLLKDMGGWPMVEGPSWNRKDYSWYKIVAECIRKLNIEVIFGVKFAKNLLESRVYKLHLSTSEDYLFLPFDEEDLYNETEHKTRNLLDSIVELAVILGSDMKTEELREEARKFIIFEHRLYEMTTFGTDDKSNVKELDEITLKHAVKPISFTYEKFLNLVIQNDVPVTGETEIYTSSLDYLKEVPKYIEGEDPRIVANYIAYRIVYEFSRYTTENILNLTSIYGYNYEEWNEKTNCIIIATKFMENALDRLYLDKYFSSVSRYHVNKMLEMMRLAFSSAFDQNTWMDKRTVFNAIKKLQNMRSTVGNPPWIADDRLLDEHYEKALDIKESDFFGAILQLTVIQQDIKFSAWNNSVNKNEGLEFPSKAVNAFYSPASNEMIIPVGILGEPFYKFGRVDSINFGAIGAIIGHEISHGFDSSGSKFNHEGDLKNWWTRGTLNKFLAKSRCFVKQYEDYEWNSKIKINGTHKLGENIADNGGVRNAFKAFRLHLALSDEDTTHRKTLPGLSATPEQLFFLGYASAYCANETEKFLAILKDDEHSPHKIRVNIPLSNSMEFARAYKCESGTPMNPRHKCVLW